jgi:hypothetical protein
MGLIIDSLWSSYKLCFTEEYCQETALLATYKLEKVWDSLIILQHEGTTEDRK